MHARIQAKRVEITAECPACEGTGKEWAQTVGSMSDLVPTNVEQACDLCAGEREVYVELEMHPEEGWWRVLDTGDGTPGIDGEGQGDDLESALRDVRAVESGLAVLRPDEVLDVAERWAAAYGKWSISRDRATHPLAELRKSGNGHRVHLIVEPRSVEGMLRVMAALREPDLEAWLRGQLPAPSFETPGSRVDAVGGWSGEVA